MTNANLEGLSSLEKIRGGRNTGTSREKQDSSMSSSQKV